MKKESGEIADRTFKILRTRIDRFGVAQPNLQLLQGGRILVELPGVKEPERVTDLLKSTAKLEFWEVYNDIVGGRSIQQRFFEADAKLAEQLKNQKENPTETAATDSVADALGLADAEVEEDEDEIEDIDVTTGAIMSKAVAVPGSFVIGYFKEADMPAINSMLPQLQRILGDNSVVFYWGAAEKEYNNAFPLYPLKKKNDRIGSLLSSETIGGARVVRTARQDVDQNNRVVVNMSMEDQAADVWRKITKEAADNSATKLTAIPSCLTSSSIPLLRCVPRSPTVTPKSPAISPWMRPRTLPLC